MRLNDKLFRGRYYLQLGWQVYLTLVFSIVNFVVVFHTFVIANNPDLRNIFPDITWFGVLVTGMLLPAAILLGFFHMKYGPKKAENYIGYQVNPYFARRLVNTEMILNTYLLLGRVLIKSNTKLTTEESKSFMNEIQTMKSFVKSRTISNKLDLTYIKTHS